MYNSQDMGATSVSPSSRMDGGDAVGDFPGGPVAKNPSCNACGVDLIPGWGTKIPHGAGHLNLHATTKT